MTVLVMPPLPLHTALILSSLILGSSGIGAAVIVGMLACGHLRSGRAPFSIELICILTLAAALYLGCAVTIWPRGPSALAAVPSAPSGAAALRPTLPGSA